MPFFDGCELIRYALDAEFEDRLFFRWALKYQTQMSFENFKNEMGIRSDEEEKDSRSVKEILETVREIIG